VPYRFELDYHISARRYGRDDPRRQEDRSADPAFTAEDYIEGFRTLRAMISIAPGAIIREHRQDKTGTTYQRYMSLRSLQLIESALLPHQLFDLGDLLGDAAR